MCTVRWCTRQAQRSCHQAQRLSKRSGSADLLTHGLSIEDGKILERFVAQFIVAMKKRFRPKTSDRKLLLSGYDLACVCGKLDDMEHTFVLHIGFQSLNVYRPCFTPMRARDRILATGMVPDSLLSLESSGPASLLHLALRRHRNHCPHYHQ